MQKVNDGTLAEGQVHTALEKLQKANKCMFMRFYDTKSTGGKALIPAQPSDYLAVIAGVPLFIEVKSSLLVLSFKDMNLRNVIQPEQLAGCKRALINKAKYVFIFYSLQRKEFELWTGAEVLQAVKQEVRLSSQPVPFKKSQLGAKIYEYAIN